MRSKWVLRSNGTETHLSATTDIYNTRGSARSAILRLVREALDRAAFELKQRILPTLGALCDQFLQQRLGVFEVGGIEAFGEPVVNVRKH
jgi:hypothetical protein